MWAIVRQYLMLFASCFAVNTVGTWVGLPDSWWRYLAVDIVVMLAVCAWWARHGLAAWWRLRRALRKPMVLDEDGNVRVPVLAPGESLNVEMGPRGPLRAEVVRPNGTVRLHSDWSTRH